MSPQPFRILFVSSGNAARGQIAEAWARTLGPPHVVARSAGTRPRPLHPIATRVMQESGVDIAAQRGKSAESMKHERFELVVTLCETAATECPAFTHPCRRVHRPFEDPGLLEDPSDPDVDAYRALRDEIRAFVEELIRAV